MVGHLVRARLFCVVLAVFVLPACESSDRGEDSPDATVDSPTAEASTPLTGTIPNTVPDPTVTDSTPDDTVPPGTVTTGRPASEPDGDEPTDCPVNLQAEQECEFRGGYVDPDTCMCVEPEHVPPAYPGAPPWSNVGPGWHAVLYDGSPAWLPGDIAGPWVLELVDPDGFSFRVAQWDRTEDPTDHWVNLQAWSPDGTEAIVDVDGAVTLIDLATGDQRVLARWQAGSGEWVGFTRPTGANLVRVWYDGTQQGFERRSRDWELLDDLVWDDLIRFTSEPGPGFDWLYAWNGEEIVVDVEALDGLHLIRNDGTYVRQLDTGLAEQCDLIRWGDDPHVVDAECLGTGVIYVHTDGSRPFFLNEAVSLLVPSEDVPDAFTLGGGPLCFFDAVGDGSVDVLGVCGTRYTWGLGRPTEEGVLQWVGGLGDGPTGNYLVDMHDGKVFFVVASEELDRGPALYSVSSTGGDEQALVPYVEGTVGVRTVIPWQGEPIAIP